MSWVLDGSRFVPTEGMLSLVFGAAGPLKVSETSAWVAWVSGGSPFAPTEDMLSLIFAPSGDMLSLVFGESFLEPGLLLRDCKPFSGTKKQIASVLRFVYVSSIRHSRIFLFHAIHFKSYQNSYSRS